MRPITITVQSSIDPEFHQAFETFFATGQDGPGFANHVLLHPLREQEVIHCAEWLARQLEENGKPDLGQLIRDALPQQPQGIHVGTPEHREFKRMKMEGTAWASTLNFGKLSEAIMHVSSQLRRTQDVRCSNCGNIVSIPTGQSSATCIQCGREITASGNVLRVG